MECKTNFCMMHLTVNGLVITPLVINHPIQFSTFNIIATFVSLLAIDGRKCLTLETAI